MICSSDIWVAKVVYENKDWNFLPPPLPALTYLLLQKSSTKTRIETSWSMILHFINELRCKSRLRKQGLKRQTRQQYSRSCQNVAKVVYENKDWNKNFNSLYSLALPMLQKSSTKTRIETCTLPSTLSQYRIVAKVVYENKDWNSFYHLIPVIDHSCCKSRLRKQGLKHTPCILFLLLLLGCCKSRLRKQGLKQLPALILSHWEQSCKSRLRKQGLKLFNILPTTLLLTKLQKSSTKTRIETSNLLEKGLIQKTVYLVKWNFTKTNCVVFLRSKNNHISLVKLSFWKKGLSEADIILISR